MIYVRYFWYLLRHKWWVIYYSRRVGASFWLCLWHDMSKFSKAEFGPYARWFYGPHGQNDNSECLLHDVADEDSRRAWAHHKASNKHHPEYWHLDALGYAIPMPERYVREMMSDWMGAGRAIDGRENVKRWWNMIGSKRFKSPAGIHQSTIRRVEGILETL